MRKKKTVIVLAVTVAVIGGFVLRTLWRAGAFLSIEPHFSGRCRLVSGPMGPEDLTIHPKSGVVYISASDRRAALAGRPVPGAIFAYDLNTDDAEPVNLTPNADTSFQPHGISLWVDEDGRDSLFVIKHPMMAGGTPDHTIEVFDLEDGGLVHRSSLTDESLVMPNDMVAVGRDEFYLTNTHHYPPGTMQTLETYLQLSRANVLHYRDGAFREALKGMRFPNGINVSRDGRTLYVAGTTDKSVQIYDRDLHSGTLRLRDEVSIGGGADNIEIDADGNLWLGAHPKMLAVAGHMADPAKLSPSQVVRVTLWQRGEYEVTEVYLNDGSELSGSSVAAVRGRRLLIGQISGDGFLDCLMDD